MVDIGCYRLATLAQMSLGDIERGRLSEGAILRRLLNDPAIASRARSVMLPSDPHLHSLNSAEISLNGQSFSLVSGMPAARLAPLIQSFWEVRGNFETAHDYILPTADMALVVSLGTAQRTVHETHGEEQLGGAWVAGPRLTPLTSIAGRDTWVCGVRMTVQGAFLALRTNPKSMIDLVVDVESLVGKQGRWLVDSVRGATHAASRFSLLAAALEQWAAAGASWNPHVGLALSAMRGCGGLIRIDALSGKIGLSRQYLHRTFVNHVGMSPKQHARLLRFQRATNLMGFRPAVDLSSTALECGYFDQAHFTRDFVSFCGLTPGEFLRFRTPQGRRGFVAEDIAQRASAT